MMKTNATITYIGECLSKLSCKTICFLFIPCIFCQYFLIPDDPDDYDYDEENEYSTLKPIFEKNSQFFKFNEFSRKTFVGHRFGTNFSDIQIGFSDSNFKRIEEMIKKSKSYEVTFQTIENAIQNGEIRNENLMKNIPAIIFDDNVIIQKQLKNENERLRSENEELRKRCAVLEEENEKKQQEIVVLQKNQKRKVEASQDSSENPKKKRKFE